MLVNGIFELRVFFNHISFTPIKAYLKNLWLFTRKSEELIDIYLKKADEKCSDIVDPSPDDILKIRNNSVKYKMLVYEGGELNIFLKQKTLGLVENFLDYQKIFIFKQRKIYSLADKSKIEVAKIKVFDTKFYTVCIESANINEFIYLYNKISMDKLLAHAMHAKDGSLINGYSQFIHYLS